MKLSKKCKPKIKNHKSTRKNQQPTKQKSDLQITNIANNNNYKSKTFTTKSKIEYFCRIF